MSQTQSFVVKNVFLLKWLNWVVSFTIFLNFEIDRWKKKYFLVIKNLALECFQEHILEKRPWHLSLKTTPTTILATFFKIHFVSSFVSLYCFCLGYSPEEPAVAEGKVLRIFSCLLSKKLIKHCESHWKRFSIFSNGAKPSNNSKLCSF